MSLKTINEFFERPISTGIFINTLKHLLKLPTAEMRVRTGDGRQGGGWSTMTLV